MDLRAEFNWNFLNYFSFADWNEFTQHKTNFLFQKSYNIQLLNPLLSINDIQIKGLTRILLNFKNFTCHSSKIQVFFSSIAPSISNFLSNSFMNNLENYFIKCYVSIRNFIRSSVIIKWFYVWKGQYWTKEFKSFKMFRKGSKRFLATNSNSNF